MTSVAEAPTNDRVSRRHFVWMDYACGCSHKEDRGHMSAQVYAEVQAECASRPCDECRSASDGPGAPLEWD
jgi:hypothetical protein